MKIQRRQLNLKFALYLIAALAVLGAGTHFLHAYQVRRNARVFVELADQAEQDGNIAKALEHLHLYMNLTPGDHVVGARYGMLLANDPEQKKSARAISHAYFVLHNVLRHEPDLHDVRRKVVELAMDIRLQRPSDAIEHLDLLLEAQGKDGELLRLRAVCHQWTRAYKQARSDFEDALAGPSKSLAVYCGLADLLRRHDSAVLLTEPNIAKVHEKADAIVKEMLATHGKSHLAHLWAARHYRDFANQIGLTQSQSLTTGHIETAASLAPDELDVILALADLEQSRKNTAKARETLQRGVELHAKKWPVYQALARLEMLDAKQEAALAALRLGLKNVPNQLDLQWNLAHLLAHQGQAQEAAEVVVQLEKQGFPQAELDYLRARIHVSQEEWRPAVTLLTRVHPWLLSRADQQRDWLAINLVLESNLLLGLCAEQLGDLDAVASAYTRAVGRAPQSVPARLGLARAEWALGKLDNAVREYHVLMQLPHSPSAAWLECAQLLITRNAKRGDWSEVERILKQAEQLNPVPVEVGLLRAEMLAVQKDFDKARGVLESQHKDKETRPVEVWIGLAGLEQRRGNQAEALALLDEAEKKYGDRLELKQARCRYWSRRGGPEAPRALDQISGALDKLNSADERRLLATLGGSYRQLGETRRAEVMWQRVATLRPNDYGSRMALFELALERADYPAAGDIVQALKSIEGPDGTLWRYCRACLIITQNQKNKETKETDEAAELLAAVAQRRPTWSRVPVAQGQLSDLFGDQERAIAYYRKAAAFGERNPAVLSRLARFAAQNNQMEEATALLEKLRDQGAATADLGLLETSVALYRQDYPEALRAAEKAIPPDSKEPDDHIWLGAVKRAAGKPADAEVEFRIAIKLAPDVGKPWIVLVDHLVRTGDKDKLAQTLADAEKALSSERGRAGLAHCFLIGGQVERARKLCETALAAGPDDRAALNVMIECCVRENRLDAAKTYLEQLMATQNLPAKEMAAAKRTLALVLASGGSHQDTLRALQHLGMLDGGVERPTAGGADELADDRSRIAILARAQNVRQRREAVALLENLLRRRRIANDERFLLAQLYESVGQWQKAQEQFLYVLNDSHDLMQKDSRNKLARQKRYADQLASFCTLLLRHEAAGRLEPWLAKLDEAEPKSLRVVTLRAHWLHKQKQSEQAIPELLALEQADDRLAGAVAGVLEQIGQTALAEQMYKKYVANQKRPEAVLPLAAYYGRHDRADEGLALCEAALKTCKIEQAVSTAVLVLYTSKATDQQCRRVASWIEAGIKQHGQRADLLTHLAAVKRVQQDYAGVISLYRQAAKLDAADTLALNNLAWLLALSERNATEALLAIERAIEIDGPQADLLDTRAVVYLAAGQHEKAAQDMKEAISERPTAHRYFHLAQAYLGAGDAGAARQAFQNGLRVGLTELTVDPLERDAFRQLRADPGIGAEIR